MGGADVLADDAEERDRLFGQRSFHAPGLFVDVQPDTVDRGLWDGESNVAAGLYEAVIAGAAEVTIPRSVEGEFAGVTAALPESRELK